MGAADGDTQRRRQERGRSAPPARCPVGGWGGHGGVGFALFPRDSPLVAARAAHSGARAHRSPGSGGAVPHTLERLVGV